MRQSAERAPRLPKDRRFRENYRTRLRDRFKHLGFLAGGGRAAGGFDFNPPYGLRWRWRSPTDAERRLADGATKATEIGAKQAMQAGPVSASCIVGQSNTTTYGNGASCSLWIYWKTASSPRRLPRR